jgi:pimeloyl-ACP methyl ester carboxylesterase
VLDATTTARASLVGFSRSAWQGILLAARHPDRVDRLVLVGSALSRRRAGFREVRERYDGWQKYNAHYWADHYRDFVEFFFTELCSEPHSTKQWEDGVGGRWRRHPRSWPPRGREAVCARRWPSCCAACGYRRS